MVGRYLGYLMLVLMKQSLINIVFEATPVTSQCPSLYYWDMNDCWVTGCWQYNQKSCSSCKPGHYSNPPVCVPCTDTMGGCLDCTSSTVCTSCDIGYTLVPTYCKSCSILFYACKYCSSNTTCTTCNNGYLLVSPTQCIQCNTFMTGCSTCSSQTVCTSC